MVIDENDYVDDSMTKEEIISFVKNNRADAPPLQDVAVSQNKEPLISAVNDAMEEYLRDMAPEADGTEVHDLTQEDEQAGATVADDTTTDDTAEEETEDDEDKRTGRAPAPPFSPGSNQPGPRDVLG